jgi:SPP1 family predicted phage head-tail adaptor
MKVCRSHFDAYCELFSKSSVDDGAGGQTVSYVSKGNIYVLIDERDANEVLDREGLETQRRVVIFTNYRPDILVTDRLELDSRALNITSVTRVGPDGRSNYRGQYLKINTDTSEWYSV